MKSRPFPLAAVLTAVFLALTLPVIQTGCGTLAPEGVYKGDMTLYRADSAINTAGTAFHDFVLFEYQNRALLASHPEIKALADQIRLHSREWLQSAINLREAYVANPTADSAGKLNAEINIIQTALTEAAKYAAQYQTASPAGTAPAPAPAP